MTRPRPDPGGSPEPRRESQHIDDLLDEAGRESFPASDPVAISSPRRPVGPGGGAHDDRESSERTRPSGPSTD